MVCHPRGKQISAFIARKRVAAVHGRGMTPGRNVWLLSLYRVGRLNVCRGAIIMAWFAVIHITSRTVRSLKGAEAMGKKKKRKPNPKNIPVTMADLERAKKQAMHEAIEMAWAIMFTALRDKEGMEIEDLKRIWNEVCGVSDSFLKGYITIADMKYVLKEEIGAELI